MSTVTTLPVKGYKHCNNPRCEGTLQQPADLIRSTTALTYIDLGGDQPHVERTFDRVTFADEDDAVCAVCDGPMACSEQLRPEYQMVVGNPDFLLHARPSTSQTADVDQLKQQVAQLQGMLAAGSPERSGDASELEALRGELAAVREELATKATKPGPKPKGRLMPGGNPSSQVGDGREVVAAAGTAVVLTTSTPRANSTCVTALSTNAGTIVVGAATVVAAAGTRRGTPLAPGESITFNADPSLIWIDATVNGDGVSFSYEAR